MAATRALATAAAALVATAYAASVPLTKLTDPKARCMDGTLSGFYWQQASAAENSTKWVFVLDGGGECTTKDACYSHLNDTLGSSKYFPAYRSTGGDFYDSDDPATNPDLATWNHVMVPYCSQDVHTGQVTTPSASTWGLYFSGHLVFAAILDELSASGGLGHATDIILSGASAGGIGVWPNVDYLQSRVPSARVVAAPVAGFYFYAYPYQGPNHTSSTLADFRPAAWPATYALWQAFVDETCAAAMPNTPWACLLSNNSYPYIEAESFETNAQTDQVVLLDHDWLPQQYMMLPPEQEYMKEWAANMSIALAPLLDPKNTRSGVFNPACFIHTSFSPSAPLLNGKNFLQTFGDWYFNRTGPEGYKLADSCGIMCNPTCPT